LKNILGYSGLILELFAAFMILPIIVATIYHEQMMSFFVAMTLSLFVGLILDKSFPRSELTISEGITLTAFMFLVLAYFASIPYFGVFTGTTSEIILNSYFESMSGITTTGLSVMPTVEEIPKSILFWRSETQWIGGMGIIVVFLSILSRLRSSSLSLYGAQGFSEKIEPSMIGTSRRILKIYILYSGIGIILLYLAGLKPFDAICTLFSAISTGGFTVIDGFYTSLWVRAVTCIIMIIGSINFFMHDKLLKKRFSEFIKNIEIKSIFYTIIIGSAFLMLLTKNAEISIFETISALTATGFTITPISTATMHPLMIMFLIALMFIGSSSGSTAGGIKQMRFITAMKSIPWTIKKISYPKTAEIPLKISGNVIDDDLIRLTGTFITTYMIFLIAGTIVLIFEGYPPMESFFQVTSAQGTVGLSIIDISVASATTKIVLICNMILGRLEIFPLLILIENMLRK